MGRYYLVCNAVWTGVNHSSEISPWCTAPPSLREREDKGKEEAIKTSIITSLQGFIPSYLLSFWCPHQYFSFLCDKEKWNYCSNGARRPQRQFVGGLWVLCVLSVWTQSTKTTLWFWHIQHVKGATIRITPHHVTSATSKYHECVAMNG